MRLLVAVLLLSLQAVAPQSKPASPPAKPSVEKRDAGEKAQDSQQATTPDNSLPAISAGKTAEKTGPTAQTEQGNAYDPKKDTLYRCYLWFTIIGVVGAFGGISVLIWQTTLSRKSANAARDAALAAKTSSQAMINSDRPWLFIKITTSDTDTDQNGIIEHLGFSVSFQNYGKTPAEVVAFDQHPDCRNDTSDLPFQPAYSLEGHVMVHTRMVPPGETWQDPGERFFYVEDFLLGDDWKEIRSSRKRFIYWGRIQYRDLIEESKTIHELKEVGTIHETCFCYFWSPARNEFLLCGPLGYNKHT